MWEYIELGPTPCDESCEQLGPNYNAGKARAESRAYANQLRRMFEDKLPENVVGGFSVKSFPHDFGSYLEVVVKFDANCELSAKWAYEVDENVPANWDDIAKTELEQFGK